MPTKVLAASGQVSDRPIRVKAILCKAGSDAMTVALANQATAGGTEVLGYGSGTAGLYTSAFIGERGEGFDTACYATLTGTAPKTWIVFEVWSGNNWT